MEMMQNMGASRTNLVIGKYKCKLFVFELETITEASITIEYEPYEKHCVFDHNPKKYKFSFTTFEAFSEELETFSKQIMLGTCDYHVFHGGDTCQALFTSGRTEKCPICLIDFDIYKMQETECGHYFCIKCLNKWATNEMRNYQRFENSGSDGDDEFFNCPVCREGLDLCECTYAKSKCICDNEI